jgi:hypothetical protein
MADKVQLKLFGIWQDLRALRLDGAAHLRMMHWTAMKPIG